MSNEICYCERMGGWIDRKSFSTWADVFHVEELPGVGSRHVVAPLEGISRELWGVAGTVDRHRKKMAFLRFDEPTKCVGATMTGVWLRADQII